MNPLDFLIATAVCFLVGSLPTAYLAGRIFKGVDIRQFGSGNVGATNAFRVLGKRIGALVFAVDLAKGALPTWFMTRIVFPDTIPTDWAVWAGLGAILGHIYTPFLGFKGGKGIATGSGVILAVYPAVYAIVIGVWGLAFMATRVVSLSSLIALLAMVVTVFLYPMGWFSRAFFFAIFSLGAWTHRSNISRLKRGEEKKIG
jgi:glycerol-3-phosphate acyltransferase PlsY